MCITGLWLLNRAGVVRPAAYILLGIPLWVAVLKSGVHATLAGVVLAMFIPLRPAPEKPEEESLAAHMEHSLHPWVAFGVLPIFAFANAGVPLAGLAPSDIAHPVPMGIMAGLFLGKQVGVFAFSWVGVKPGLASRPEGVGWGALYGTALLCGIGFTMSLFIASLGFEGVQQPGLGLERLGILLGTLVSGVVGYFVPRRTLRSPQDDGV